MRTLVFGGAGYIGSVVAARLLEEGHDVTVADNLLNGHEDAVPEGAFFVRADLADQDGVRALLVTGFDAVLHFAALSLVAESVAEPARYFRANVGGTITLLDEIRAAGIPEMVSPRRRPSTASPTRSRSRNPPQRARRARTARRSSPSTRRFASNALQRGWPR